MVELKALSAAQVSKVAIFMGKELAHTEATAAKPASSKKRATPAESSSAAVKKPKASPKVGRLGMHPRRPRSCSVEAARC